MSRCHANFMHMDFNFHANFIHISCTCFHTPSGSFHVNFMHLFSHPFWDPFTQISRTGTLLIDRGTIIFVLCRLRGLQISLVFHTASPQAWHMYAGAAWSPPSGGKWPGRQLPEKCTACCLFLVLNKALVAAPYLGKIAWSGDRLDRLQVIKSKEKRYFL